MLAQGGDIDILAKDVLINAGYDLSDSSSHSAFSKLALGGTVSIPLVNAVQGIASLASAAKEAGGGRMNALAAMTAAANASQAVQSIDPAAPLGGIKVSVSLGSTKSESNVVQTSSTAVASQVLAGGNVNIVASGGDKASNITSIGSQISAGGDASLRADNAVNLLAAENTFSQHSTNRSSGASVGVGFTFGGAQQGFTLDLAVSKSQGRADGDELSHTNTQLSAGNKVTLQSGGDTTLKGGVITAAAVSADIGGDLKIESLQDRTTYDSKQTSAGLNASLCIPPFCYGASTVGGSFSKSAVNGDFLSVLEQSGIKAGDGGFQVSVGGSSDLIGGVISSSQAAIDNGKNSLSTASLTYSMLQNRDVYEASGFAMSGSVSANVGNQASATTAEQKDAVKAGKKAGPAASGGFGSASGSQQSVTLSGISAGELTITDPAKQAATSIDTDALLTGLKRDITTDSAAKDSGALTQGWNGEKLDRQMQAQVEITQAFTSAAAPLAAKTVGDIADGRRDAARSDAKGYGELAEQAAIDGNKDLANVYITKQKQANATAELWEESGAYRVGLHAASQGLIGAAAGGGIGAAGSMAGVAGGSLGRDFGKAQGEVEADKLGLTGNERKEFVNTYQQTMAAVGGALGGLAAGTAAGQSGTALANTTIYASGTASAVDTYNRRLHDNEKEKLEELKKGRSSDEQRRLDDAACALIKCADGLSDENPEKIDLLSQQQRGATYRKEIATLTATNMFDYGAGYAMMDAGARALDRGSLELASAGRGASNLFNLITEQLSPNADVPGNSGGPGGPTAGAVQAVPTYRCNAAGCVIEWNVAATPGTYPTNAVLSAGGWGDGGEGRSRESGDESRRRETSSDSGRNAASGNSGGNGEKPSAGARAGSEKLANVEGADSTSGAVGEGVIASRVNVRTGDANVKGSGLEYAWKKHGGDWGANKSSFTIPKDELQIILQDTLVVQAPAYKSPTSGNYIRTVDMGRTIGVDAKAGGQATSFITVITDAKGNLINTFPGKTR